MTPLAGKGATGPDAAGQPVRGETASEAAGGDRLAALLEVLRDQHGMLAEVLGVVRGENEALRGGGSFSVAGFQVQRKALLLRLSSGLESLRRHTAWWLGVGLAQRRRHPEMARLLRSNQETIMKVVVLDRENERMLLQRGLLASTAVTPAARGPAPHYAVAVYRRAAGLGN